MTQGQGSKWDRLEWLRGDGPVAPAARRAGPEDLPQAVRIPYRPGLGRIVLAVVFFGACAAFLRNEARTNDRGLVINGLVELSVSGATVFYWVLCGSSVALVAAAVFVGLPQWFIPRFVVLEPDAITIPGWGLSTRHYRIPRCDIRGVHVSSYRKYRFLKVLAVGGTRSINSGMLPLEGDFDVILGWFQSSRERVPRA